MISEPSLSVLAAVLKPFTESVYRKWSRLRVERQAGQVPITQPSSVMDDLLSETLNRIRQVDSDAGWWRGLLDYSGHRFIAPDFLKKPALREWLDEEEVEKRSEASCQWTDNWLRRR